MELLDAWTGRTACLLQEALRLTNEAFAQKLGLGLRTVADWHKDPNMTPRASTQQILDTALEQASDTDKRRFAQLAGLNQSGDREQDDGDHRLSDDPNVGAALEWIDRHAGWTPGTARRTVAAQLATVDLRHIQDRGHRRGQINQRQVAESLGAYYGALDGYGRYRPTVDGERLDTSILTMPEWLDLEYELTPETDALTFANTLAEPHVQLDDIKANVAAAAGPSSPGRNSATR